MPTPNDPTEVTLGEVNRNLERLSVQVATLSEQITRYPKWQDLDRMATSIRSEYTSAVSAGVAQHAPLEDRIKDLEAADGERQREARGMRGQSIGAFISAGLSLAVTLLVVVLTGR